MTNTIAGRLATTGVVFAVLTTCGPTRSNFRPSMSSRRRRQVSFRCLADRVAGHSNLQRHDDDRDASDSDHEFVITINSFRDCACHLQLINHCW